MVVFAGEERLDDGASYERRDRVPQLVAVTATQGRLTCDATGVADHDELSEDIRRTWRCCLLPRVFAPAVRHSVGAALGTRSPHD